MSNAHESAMAALESAAAMLRPGTPSIADFKEARDLAKSAHETLDAAYKLLSKGILAVIDKDDPEPTPLFDPKGEPTPEADVDAPEADLSIPALGYTEQGIQDAEIVEETVVFTQEDGQVLADGEPLVEKQPTEDEILASCVNLARKIAERDGKINTRTIETELGIPRKAAKVVWEKLEAEGTINKDGEFGK